ncbi:MarR family winged helix-turn-helix transcriptional regulator [Acanthopleuribacter pedis]
MSHQELSNHTEATVLQFLETAHALQRDLDNALSLARGISFSEYRILRALANVYSGGAPRIDLARAVGLTPSAVTRALKPLEKLGYVTTEKGGRDARQSRAVLTTGGRTLLDDTQGVLRDTLMSLPINQRGMDDIELFRACLGECRR